LTIIFCFRPNLTKIAMAKIFKFADFPTPCQFEINPKFDFENNSVTKLLIISAYSQNIPISLPITKSQIFDKILI